MTLSYRRRPGKGFVLLLVVTALCGSFFAWALSPPALDETARRSDARQEAH